MILPVETHAALDWSGRPAAPHSATDKEYLVPGLVVFRDRDDPHEELTKIKARHGYGVDFEFKGFQIRKNEDALIDVLTYIAERCTVFALTIDKHRISQSTDGDVFENPALLAPATGLILVERAANRQLISQIVVDEGDVARPLRRKFNTAVRRTVFELTGHPLHRLHPKHYRSDKWPSIQFADVICNVLNRHARGRLAAGRVMEMINEIRRRGGNEVLTDEDIDLRPYLQM